jgi:hypothetical protein
MCRLAQLGYYRPRAQDVPQARSTFSRVAALRASTAGMNKAMTGMCNLTPTLALVSAVLLGGLALPDPGKAQPAGKAQPGNLAGSWSGGGVVSFASGSRERARCRAHYSRRSSTTYAMSATCATASGRAAQTASLRSVGANSYQGSFYNSEYNISGTIYVVVRGNSQSVQLSSSAGSASLQLSR